MPVVDSVLGRMAASPTVLKFGQRLAKQIDPTAMAPVVPSAFSLDKLSPEVAALLNIEKGPNGFASAAGVWFNPAVEVWYGEGSVTVQQVSERIVEVPCVISSIMGALEPGGRVLDFGASESTVAFTLASLGYQVTALDSREYPFSHPNLEVVRTLVEDWKGPEEPYDRVVAVSAIEHVGLGYYDGAEGAGIDDRRLLGMFGSWLKPSGQVTVTVPYGTWNVDQFMRTYDDVHLDALFEGWDVLDRRIWTRATPTTWLSGRQGSPGVAIITARPG